MSTAALDDPRRAGPRGPATDARRVRRRWSVLFVGGVLAAFALLVALDLNGSSASWLDPGTEASSVVAGTPRRVRTDEYRIATPLAVSAARQGFPGQPWTGLVRAPQLALAHGGPVRSPLELLKPQDWGYLLLGAARGLAWHWWAPYAAALIGVFALLRILGTRPPVAAGLAVVAALSPYTAWWSAPAPGLVLGYGAGVGALAVAALQTRRARAAVPAALGAGVVLAVFALALYPPWQVSVGLTVAAVAIGRAVDVRAGLRRVVLTAAGIAVAGGPLVGAWYVSNRAAIQATADTVYPGTRRSQGGGGVFPWLFDAPLNPLLSTGAGTTLQPASGGHVSNLSEVSATQFPLPVLLAVLLLVGLRVLRRRHAPAVGPAVGVRPDATPRCGGVLTALGAVLAVFLVWALLPVPAVVGRVLLLDRVPATRLPLAFGLLAVLLLAVGSVAAAPRRPAPGAAGRGRSAGRAIGESLVWVLGGAATVGATVWASASLPWKPAAVPAVAVVGLAVLLALGATLVAAGRAGGIAAIGLAVVSLGSFALVNPLMHGLGPMEHDPLVRALRASDIPPGTPTAVFGNLNTVSLVRSSGLQVTSGTTPYPDVELMRELAPGRQRSWNNYVTYLWTADRAADPVVLQQVRGTTFNLRVDPCAPDVTGIGIRYAVSEKPLSYPCLRLVERVPDPPAEYHVYRVTAVG